MKYIAALKTPVPANAHELVYRIIMDETACGTYVYLCCSPDTNTASYDEWYENTETAMAAWNEQIDERGWIPLN